MSYGVVGGDCCGGGVVGVGVGGTIVEPAQGPTLAPSVGAPTPAPAPPAPGSAPPSLPQPPAPGSPVPAPKSSVELRSDSALLTIWVPEDAKVFVNGYETKSTGNCRKYVSHGLKSGFSYRYEIRAVVQRNGSPVEELHHATLTAGGEQKVAFSFKASPERLAANW